MENIGYWSLPPRERALLDRDAVNKYTGVELMRLGVPRAVPPTFETPEDVAPATVVAHVARDGTYGTKLAFHTLEQAEAFARLQPLDIHEEWDTKQKFVKPWTETNIVRVDVMSENEHSRLREVFKRNADIRKRNEESAELYRKASAAEDAALSEIRDDWQERRDEEANAQRIKATWTEYVQNCNGDEAIAATFLVKLYGALAVVNAFVWLGLQPPSGTPEAAATVDLAAAEKAILEGTPQSADEPAF